MGDTKRSSTALVSMVFITLITILVFSIAAMSVSVTVKNELNKIKQPSSRHEAAPIKDVHSNTTDVFARYAKSSDKIINLPMHSLFPLKKPAAVINTSFIPPTINQGEVGDCWMNSIIRAFEANYVKNGIEKGYLKPGQWVNFSRQKLGSVLIEACAIKNPPTWCIGGLTNSNPLNISINGGFSSTLYWAQDALKDAFIPESLCGYNMDETTQKQQLTCKDGVLASHYGSDVAVKFNTVSMMTFPNIMAVYDRIISTNGQVAGLVAGTSLLGSNSILDLGSTVPEYLKGSSSTLFKCPSDPSNYCMIQPNILMKDNQFYSTPESIPVDGHSMVIAAVDPELLVPNISFTGLPLSKGAIIFANSWGNVGNSLEYLLGARSTTQEASTCGVSNFNPNFFDGLNCVPQQDGPCKGKKSSILSIRPSASNEVFSALVSCSGVEDHELGITLTAVQNLTGLQSSSISEMLVLDDPPMQNFTRNPGPECYFLRMTIDYFNTANLLTDSQLLAEYNVTFPDESYYKVSCEPKPASGMEAFCDALQKSTIEKASELVTPLLYSKDSVPQTGGNVIVLTN